MILIIWASGEVRMTACCCRCVRFVTSLAPCQMPTARAYHSAVRLSAESHFHKGTTGMVSPLGRAYVVPNAAGEPCGCDTFIIGNFNRGGCYLDIFVYVGKAACYCCFAVRHAGGSGAGLLSCLAVIEDPPSAADYILITGGQNGQTPLADAYLLSVCPYIRYGQLRGVHALAGYPATCATLRWRWPVLLAFKPQGKHSIRSCATLRSRQDTFREGRIDAARSSDTATNFSPGHPNHRRHPRGAAGHVRPLDAVRERPSVVFWRQDARPFPSHHALL
jgi:hypothetical protein